MCPRGKGFVPVGESSYDTGGENYKGQYPVQISLQVCQPLGWEPGLGDVVVEFCWAVETVGQALYSTQEEGPYGCWMEL